MSNSSNSIFYALPIGLFFTPRKVEAVQRYSHNYLARAIVVALLFAAIYALTKNWKLGAVLAVVFEISVSDAYTKQLMPPAFLMLTEKLRESEQDRYVLFFYVNWLLFGVMSGYVIALESVWQ